MIKKVSVKTSDAYQYIKENKFNLFDGAEIKEVHLEITDEDNEHGFKLVKNTDGNIDVFFLYTLLAFEE
jgi:hypothetical protein